MGGLTAASVVETSQQLALLVHIAFDPGTGYDLVLKDGAGLGTQGLNRRETEPLP
jgi:hypothetical protein